MKLRFASLLQLALLLIGLTVGAVGSDITLYSNGPAGLNDPNAWKISFGSMVSDSFYIGSASTVTKFSVALWTENQGEQQPPTGLDWSITSLPLGAGTVYGGESTFNLKDVFFTNKPSPICAPFTCDVWQVTVSFDFPVSLGTGTYWLNLSNAETAPGDPVYWDENDGNGCTGWNGSGSPCPSGAFSTDTVGPIGSEDPDIIGHIDETTPEPSSLVLLGSGVLGFGAMLRYRVNR